MGMMDLMVDENEYAQSERGEVSKRMVLYEMRRGFKTPTGIAKRHVSSSRQVPCLLGAFLRETDTKIGGYPVN